MMDLSWQEALVVGPLLITVPTTLALIVHLYRRKGLYDFPLMLLMSAATVWATAYALEVVLPTFEQKMSVVMFEYIGIVLVPVGWLLLGLQLNEQLHRLKAWMVILLLIVPMATLVQVNTWRSWDVYWTSQELVRYGALELISVTYGPGFWVHIVYSYLLQLIGGILILSSVFRSNDFYVPQRIALATALILPWTANAVYIFKLTSIAVDFTPSFIVAGGILIAVGVFRYGLGDLLPVARDKVFSDMKEGVLLLDEQRRLIDANEAALQLFGIGSNDMGKSATSLFDGHREVLALIEPGAPSRELLYRGFDDGRPFSVKREEIVVGRGARYQMLVFHDLALDNRVETALRLVVESTSADTGEGFFRSLTRSLGQALGARHVLVGTLDESNRRVRTLSFWSDGRFADNVTYDLAGTPCERLLTQRVLVVPDRVADEFPRDTLLTDLGVRSYVGLRLTGFDNSKIGNIVVMNDTPLDNEEACVSVLDVFAIRAAAELERQRSDVRIQESEARYRRIVETTRDGVCVVDPQGRVEFLNDPMARMIGRSKSDVSGESLRAQFRFPDSGDDALSFENDTVEVPLLRGDGTRLWVVISKTVIPGAGNDSAGMLMMFTDVTESQLLREQHQQIERQLQHAQKLESLGVLAGGIAHDFNNLLMPVIGYLDLVQDRVAGDGVVVEYLDRMRDAGAQLTKLCNQMLMYSGRGQFLKNALDVNDSLKRLQGLIRASVSKSLQIDYQLSEGLSAIRADDTQLDQVVMNLVINASEAMSGVASGTIAVSTGEQHLDALTLKGLSNGDSAVPGRFVYLEVSDEGCGMSDDHLARLFEPFFTTKFTGRGLGMSVVFGIVKGHSGAIRVVSSPRGGTSIRVYFPAARGERPHAQSGPVAHVTGRVRGLVLVVDDESMVRELVSSVLESAGYRVACANNGGSGYRAYLEHERELVGCVIDVTMPGLDGYDLIRNIQRHRLDLPIILASGYPVRASVYDALDGRNLTFLQKPFDKDALIDAFDRLHSNGDARGSIP